MGYYQRTLVRFRFDFSFRAIEEWLLRWRAALRPLALKARRSVRPALRHGSPRSALAVSFRPALS